MRNQLARVVLAAVLGVASAVAQAPASSIRYFQQHGESAGSRWSATSEDVSDPVELAPRPDWNLQDGGDYSVTTLFRESHGEFMDRRERYDPAIEIGARWMPNQSIKSEPGEFSMLGTDLDAEFPIVIYPDSYLLLGTYHSTRRYQTSDGFGTQGNPGGGWPDETVTATGVRLGIGVFLSNHVLLEAEINPGIYSDMEQTLKSRDYDCPSSAMVTVQATNDFFFKFGARYNQIYEDAPWLPWLGFSWEMAEGLRFDFMLPEYAELAWWPSASTSFAIGTQVTGAQYRLTTTATGAEQSADINVQEVFAYIGMTRRFSDQFSFNARAGSILAGHYDVSTGAANFLPTTGALDQGVYIDLTLGIDW